MKGYEKVEQQGWLQLLLQLVFTLYPGTFVEISLLFRLRKQVYTNPNPNTENHFYSINMQKRRD